ncbi:PH domain-containing protein [Nocardioides scoriae]|uniref:PH domain-containing protein n=1 Tax=Nocardioides scoriae TaxID=642780 RepID=A0A1H1PQK1_9ACTN|nr:PH domain-containing protein [Nocardioides scoriae]SDS13039.1 PH domain-containing protein [Nocardioides scoriae]
MPAASEAAGTSPELPRTWRPLGARIAVYVFGGMLVAMLVAVWFALGAEVRASFTIFQRLTLVVLGVMLFACYHALVRSRVVATEAGLVVVNGYRTHRYEWSQVIAVQLGRGAPWGTLDLSDGETVSMIAIQGSDGDRARRAVRELRVLVAAHTPAA